MRREREGEGSETGRKEGSRCVYVERVSYPVPVLLSLSLSLFPSPLPLLSPFSPHFSPYFSKEFWCSEYPRKISLQSRTERGACFFVTREVLAFL